MKKVLSALFILLTVYVSAQEKIYAPTLTAPVNAAINQNVNVLLDWAPVASAVKYEVNLDTSASFTNPQVVVVTYSAWQSANLLFGSVYYWRVRAIDASNLASGWSLVRNFTTVAAPTTAWPTQNSHTASLAPVLKWNLLSGVTKYECQFDSAATFDSPWLKQGIVSNTNNFHVYGNDYGDNYYYRVRGIHINDTSDWSVPVNFFTRDSVAFALNSPSNNAIDIHPADTLRIKGIYGTNRYEVNFDTNSSFSSPTIFYWDSLAINIRYMSTELYDTTARGAIDTIPFGTFYYRIRLMTDNDTSKWTETRMLSTINKVTLVSPADSSVGVLESTSFTWSAIRGAQYYILEYDTAATFASAVSVNVTGTSYTPATNLLPLKDYFWRVSCVTVCDTTPDYNVFSFKTRALVGVEENPIGSWSVYPNPTTGVFSLNLESVSSARLEIMNLLGDVVYSKSNLENGTNVISIENLNDGIYMMRLYLNDKLYTSRIVKK